MSRSGKVAIVFVGFANVAAWVFASLDAAGAGSDAVGFEPESPIALGITKFATVALYAIDSWRTVKLAQVREVEGGPPAPPGSGEEGP